MHIVTSFPRQILACFSYCFNYVIFFNNHTPIAFAGVNLLSPW